MSQNSNLEDDEIDLSELLAALWCHKLLILLFTGLSIFLAGYYALTTEKKFTAKSVFQIDQNNSAFDFPFSAMQNSFMSVSKQQKEYKHYIRSCNEVTVVGGYSSTSP